MVDKRQMIRTKILFFLYFIILTWGIVFKMRTDFNGFVGYRRINLIPFHASVIINGRIDTSEIYLNICAFVPFGVYISILKEKWSFFQKLLPIFLISLSYETSQYIFAVGVTDITDLLGNTCGGLIGIVIYWLLSKVLKDNTIKVVNFMAIIGTVFLMALIGILIFFN